MKEFTINPEDLNPSYHADTRIYTDLDTHEKMKVTIRAPRKELVDRAFQVLQKNLEVIME